MKLYAFAGSNNVRKVLAVANHLGLKLDVEYLDFFAGEARTKDYLALNPNGKVPTLKDGDFTLWESNAINRYLCSQVPGNMLYPENPRTQAKIDQWLCWELAHYNKMFGVLAWESVAKPNFLGQEGDPKIIDWSRAYLQEHAKLLDKHMQNREYVVGDDITIADYALIHIEFFKEMVPFDWNQFPALNAYYDRMRAVPHWQMTAVAPDKMGKKPQPA